MKIRVSALFLISLLLATVANSTEVPAQDSVASQEAREPRRFAVVVGINDYSGHGLKAPRKSLPPGSERQSWKQLSGAVADAESIATMLRERYGFASEDVTLLTDQQATRGAILSAIEVGLVQRVEKGDLAVFFYAGHGSQAPNSASREVDAFDETLVPADVMLGASEIRDKELHARLLPILEKGARLVVLLDSCHSGSGTRGEEFVDGVVRGLVPNPKDVASFPKPVKTLWELGALILSSTQDDGLAWETVDKEGQARGAFSWALLRALRMAEPGEAWEEVFARTRTLLRLESRPQEPVLEGLSTPRQSAVLGEARSSVEERFSFMAQGSLRGGRVALQGGWAHGLTEGSELVAFGGTKKEIRLRVVELQQLVGSFAEILEPPMAVVEPGTRFEVVRWAVPPSQPLRVWIPEDPGSAQDLAQQLAGAAAAREISWVRDPSEPPYPSHRLRWTQDRWWLDGGGRVDLGAKPTVGEVLAHLKLGDRLFVQVPVPQQLVAALAMENSETPDRVERVAEPGQADYHLVGRFDASDQVLEFAWLLRSAMVASGSHDLPVRSRWARVSTDSGPTGLRGSLITLARAFGWHRLPSPPHSKFPYHLEIRSSGRRSRVVRELVLDQKYDIFLKANPDILPQEIGRRYVYVFAIDPYGDSYLLFPRQGNVENRFPLRSAGTKVARSAKEYALGEQPSFRASEPLGMDTFFLLTSREPLWDPWILQFGAQTRSPDRPGSLDQLLWWIGSGSRSPQPVSTPLEWSIDRVLYPARSREGSHQDIRD